MTKKVNFLLLYSEREMQEGQSSFLHVRFAFDWTFSVSVWIYNIVYKQESEYD